MVNGQTIAPAIERGYAVLKRRWQSGDTIEIDFDLQVRRIAAHPAMVDNRGKVALTRGPLMYCVEGVDHDGDVDALQLDDDATLTAFYTPDLSGGATVVRGTAQRA